MKTFKELKEKLNEYYTVHIHDENDKPDFVGDPTKYSSSAVQKSLKHTQKGKTVTIKSKDHLGTVDSVVVKPGSYVKKYVDQLKTKRNEQTVKEDIELEEQHREVGRFHPTVPYNVPNVKTPKPRHSGSSLSTQYRNANKESAKFISAKKVAEGVEQPKDYPGEKGHMWYPTGKTAKHFETGKKTYEYAEYDKEGQKTGARHYKDIHGKHMGESVEEFDEQHREVGRFHPTVPYNVPNVNLPKPRHSGSSLSTQYRNANKDSTRLKTHSLVKDLIKKRLNKPFGEETTEVSKKTKMIKDIAKNKNDKFQSEPIITDTLVKTANQ